MRMIVRERIAYGIEEMLLRFFVDSFGIFELFQRMLLKFKLTIYELFISNGQNILTPISYICRYRELKIKKYFPHQKATFIIWDNDFKYSISILNFRKLSFISVYFGEDSTKIFRDKFNVFTRHNRKTTEIIKKKIAECIYKYILYFPPTYP